MLKKLVLITLTIGSLFVAGDAATKVKSTTPTICCVVPCTPPLVCKVK